MFLSNRTIADLTKSIKELKAAIDSLRKVVSLRQPLPLSFNFIKEDDMSNIVFTLNVPAVNTIDTVLREITPTIDGVAQEPVLIDDMTAVLTPELKAPKGSTVSVVLVDIDNSDNRSEPSDAFEAVMADTFAPPQPGQLSFNFIREEEDAPVVPPVE